jgi:hypothetical protein
MLRKVLRKALLVVAVLFVAVAAFAQDVAPPMPIGANEMEKLVIVLFAAVLPFVTDWIRKAKPTMPRMLVWSIPPVLGALAGWVVAYFAAAGPVNSWRGLAGGLIAIALHEARTTFNDHGINGS